MWSKVLVLFLFGCAGPPLFDLQGVYRGVTGSVQPRKLCFFSFLDVHGALEVLTVQRVFIETYLD